MLPICAAFCSGTGLRFRHSQTCRISELGNQVKFFDTFDRGFSKAEKLFALGQLLKVVHGGKEFSSNVLSNQACARTGEHRWGPLPISMDIR